MEWFVERLYRWGAYALFTFTVFVVALLVTFPDGQIKRIAAVQIEHQLERNLRTGYAVEIGDLDPWWLGFELETVVVEERSTTKGSGGGDGESTGSNDDSTVSGPATSKKSPDEGAGSGPSDGSKMTVEIPSIGARLAPLGSLLNLGLSASYYLGLGGGSISGAYTRTSGAQYLTVSIESLDLEKSTLLEKLTGLPMFGVLDGYGTFTFAAGRPVLTDGKFELGGQKITVGPKPKLKVGALPVGHISVPQVNFGNLELDLFVESRQKGRPTLRLDQFKSQGRDLQLQIWGTMNLVGGIGRADTELKTRIRFNSEFAQKNQPIQALQRHRKFQNGQAGEWYGLVFSGPLNALQWEGSPTAAQGPPNDGGSNGGRPRKKGG